MINKILSVGGIIILTYAKILLVILALYGLMIWSRYFVVSTPFIDLVYGRRWYMLNLLSTLIIYWMTCWLLIDCVEVFRMDIFSMWNTYINSEVIS